MNLKKNHIIILYMIPFRTWTILYWIVLYWRWPIPRAIFIYHLSCLRYLLYNNVNLCNVERVVKIVLKYLYPNSRNSLYRSQTSVHTRPLPFTRFRVVVNIKLKKVKTTVIKNRKKNLNSDIRWRFIRNYNYWRLAIYKT